MLEALLATRPAVNGQNPAADKTLVLLRAADGFQELAYSRRITKYSTPGTNSTFFKFNKLSFDFTNGWVGIGEISDFVFTKDDEFTYEYWQYVPSLGSYNQFITKGLNTTSDLKTFNNDLYLQTETVYTSAPVSGVMKPSTWQHVALVQYQGVLTLYVDGVVKMTLTATGNFGRNDVQLMLGGGSGSSAGGWSYSSKGYMDQLRVSRLARYTAAFTPPTTRFEMD